MSDMFKSTINTILFGVLVVFAFAVLGNSLYEGVKYFKDSERTVTVKGLSEREVKADIAILPLSFKYLGNDIATIYDEMERRNSEIVEFLVSLGFEKSEIGYSAPTITDRKANYYGNGNFVGERYLANATITLYTSKVDLVLESMKKVGELGKKGIAIASDDYSQFTEFIFTNLNEIKPDMIKEATKNAREVAEKFAKDSDSALGKIKQASQGQFSIYNRDNSTPYIKKVRVVSTVEYFLVN